LAFFALLLLSPSIHITSLLVTWLLKGSGGTCMSDQEILDIAVKLDHLSERLDNFIQRTSDQLASSRVDLLARQVEPLRAARVGGALVATHYKAVHVDAAKAEETRAKAKAKQEVNPRAKPKLVARNLDVAKVSMLILSSAICAGNMGIGAESVQTE